MLIELSAITGHLDSQQGWQSSSHLLIICLFMLPADFSHQMYDVVSTNKIWPLFADNSCMHDCVCAVKGQGGHWV